LADEDDKLVGLFWKVFGHDNGLLLRCRDDLDGRYEFGQQRIGLGRWLLFENVEKQKPIGRTGWHPQAYHI
jgi:hypothetical protein